MKKFNVFISYFGITVILASLLFLGGTIVSSVQYCSDAVPDFICIKRGYPFNYINIDNQGNHLSVTNLVVDFLIAGCISICLLSFCIWIYRGLGNRTFYMKGMCALCAVILMLCNIQYAYAATVRVQSWRIIRYGKLSYNCLDKYSEYAAVARKKWNDYKPGVITEKNNPDLIIRDSSELGSSIAGVTYSHGVIYFNQFVWTMMNERQRKNCAIHEMGHALGLDHHRLSEKSVMYQDITETITLSAGDKASYDTSYALSFYCA